MEKKFEEMSQEEQGQFVLHHLKPIMFYKEDGAWFADLECTPIGESVLNTGANAFLDTISEGRNSISFDISDKPYIKTSFLLKRIQYDESGATYEVLSSSQSWCFNIVGKKLQLPIGIQSFFGEYPEYISIL